MGKVTAVQDERPNTDLGQQGAHVGSERGSDPTRCCRGAGGGALEAAAEIEKGLAATERRNIAGDDLTRAPRLTHELHRLVDAGSAPAIGATLRSGQ